MRFLLSLILSAFFFFSPFQGNASEVSGKLLKTNIDNSKTTLPGYSLSDDYTVAHINFSHRNSSTTQNRFYPFTNFIAAKAFQNEVNFFYEEKRFVQPHSYCKRIGLKLIFPEHYFW